MCPFLHEALTAHLSRQEHSEHPAQSCSVSPAGPSPFPSSIRRGWPHRAFISTESAWVELITMNKGIISFNLYSSGLAASHAFSVLRHQGDRRLLRAAAIQIN